MADQTFDFDLWRSGGPCHSHYCSTTLVIITSHRIVRHSVTWS